MALVAFYLIGRFWCRYICPLGGILGIFNRVSILKLKLDMNKCTDCKECLKVCPVDIDKFEDVGKSSDCIQCGKCIDTCPTNSMRVKANRIVTAGFKQAHYARNMIGAETIVDSVSACLDAALTGRWSRA